MTITFLLEVAVPVTLVVLMTTIGVSLTVSDLGRALGRPRLWLGLTLLQVAFLPPLAWLAGLLSVSEPWLVLVLFSLAVSPGGAFSNVFTFIAGGNVPLSIVLTGASTALSVFLSPLLLGFGARLLDVGAPLGELDAVGVARNMALFVLLPLLAGSLIPRLVPGAGAAVRRFAAAAAAMAVLGLVVLAAIVSAPHLGQVLLPVLGASGTFLAGALGAGLLVSRWLAPEDRSAVVIEFGARNVTIALFLLSGASADARTVACLLVHFMIGSFGLLAVSLVLRFRAGPRPQAANSR